MKSVGIIVEIQTLSMTDVYHNFQTLCQAADYVDERAREAEGFMSGRVTCERGGLYYEVRDNC